jgi:hypothetical protein
MIGVISDYDDHSLSQMAGTSTDFIETIPSLSPVANDTIITGSQDEHHFKGDHCYQ